MSLSREICKLCFRANPVGFSVPDEVWADAIPVEHQSQVVCISCFARLADEKLIPWDRDICLYPVSMHAHLEACRVPNDLTIETLDKTDRGEDIKDFDTVEELFEDLDDESVLDVSG